ncbi:FAD-binding oxidoreductase [Conexibacter arvalis]|uniref:FAD/FMN-containing dehydrogenase n=1 Tax=Conexibacter arvalis TaxID=912552 RepID=A0A840IE66_9ACTN|nr:FAD-dependent oxidoreductase [Conexibacter arvalis]MBB4662230.1 FAD/FMN-containing dehydrogenase [Conexibacter arvalis]
MTTDASLDLSPLRAALRGHALAPGDDGWDAARQAWNLAADLRPAAVVYAEEAAEIAATMRFAGERGLRVAMQGTGHGAPALGDLSDTLLLKTQRMAAVEIDPARRVARAQAGALWGDVAVSAGRHGLAALHGSSPDVGVVGYTLGGGLSWLARRHGLASSKVVAFEVVTADGAQRRVTADADADLFWALRGGGGAFALVTAIEFELLPLAEAFAGTIAWPGERGAELLAAWREWTATLPDATTSSFRWLQLPPLPEVPEPLRGRPTVAITAVHDGPATEADALLASLRALGGATLDRFAVLPAPALCHINGDPEQPTPAFGDHALLSALDDAAAAALSAAAGPEAGHPLVGVELRHLGGALGRAPRDAGALAWIDGEQLLFAFGIPMGPDGGVAIRSALDGVLAAVAPVRSGSVLNFADTPVETASAFDAETWRRLQQVKAAVDPGDLIRSNRPVPPA